MRSLQENQSRWKETQSHGATLEDLQHAVRHNGSSSPCVSGCRSVCWKTFLLSSQQVSWPQALQEGRQLYTEKHGHFLKFINHPEALSELTIDPLTDDPDSPWNTVRQDEIIRAEILQDVQRLPDEVCYHEDRIQGMILDILFVYCKLYPNRGGYRQGMHELLAPMVYAVEQDAIDRKALDQDGAVDDQMLHILNAEFIEHDAFLLFDRLMSQAQSFYEIKDAPTQTGQPPIYSRTADQSSAIVERSKFIHEVRLHKVDPELATHLTNVEILPQIFLIRWIRLIFSREFPFEQFLNLWDTFFAIDPTLELIDLVCVAMLVRIRWKLLEADYSVCLQLLLKYPPPAEAYGPHTFVDDALYLRDHLDPDGGAYLIEKYTGRMPTVQTSSDDSRPDTLSFKGFNSFRQRGLMTRSPLLSPSRLMQQQGRVEAIFQNAAKGAKGVLERGEKLGINQAVRDAVGEIRRNLNEARYPTKSPRQVLSEEGPASGLAALEQRNQQLAAMLDETIDNLKSLSASGLDDKLKSLDLIEVAAAKVQFVKIYLEDSSMEVPTSNSPPPEDNGQDLTNERDEGEISTATQPSDATKVYATLIGKEEVKTTAEEELKPQVPTKSESTPSSPQVKGTDPLATSSPLKVRPLAPIPTRSTLAQSSFSWMLEPDESSSSLASAASRKSPAHAQHKKKASQNASRERNAFLFGEGTLDVEGRAPSNADEIFGLEPLDKSKGHDSIF